MMKKTILLIAIISLSLNVFSQGYFSGDLELRTDFYLRDTSTLGTAGNPQYDLLKSSMDSWLSSKYRNDNLGLEVGLRLDFHINSKLHDPNGVFTKVKLGNFFIKKKIEKLTITGGHFYDQFGGGIAFRAYEDRFLGIDNSLFGVHAKYDLTKDISVKAFGGLRNDRLSENTIGTSDAFIKGINAEGVFSLGEKVSVLPGVSVVNRTLGQDDMKTITNKINNYVDFNDRFIPVYNTYVLSAYNTLNFKKISWYIEGAYKTKEALFVAIGEPYINKAGNILYTSLTYSTKGFGITGQFKRTDHFQFRDSPNNTSSLLKGALNFLPPINKQHSVRLPSRYAPASQEMEEVAFSLDITKKINKKLGLQFTFSEIHDLDVSFKHWAKTLLFREAAVELDWKASKKLKGDVGFQFAQYNTEFYEGHKGNANEVLVYTPYVELVYKLDRKKSVRAEFQYQNTEKDFGHWAFALIEFSMAPNFTFSVTDQWNIAKGPNDLSKNNEHYYSIFTSYTHRSTRFSAAFVRQVGGIVCTGGVCRPEPAFNGVKFGLNTSF